MNLSEQSKDIINSLWQFQPKLAQIMPNDLAEYIIDLIAKDQAHQKLLKFLEEENND